MPLFSNRHRPYWMGPFPLERLSHGGTPHNGDGPALSPAARRLDSPVGVAKPAETLRESLAHYLGIFSGLRDGDVASTKAELEFEPTRMAENLKASCYFLDAAMVGVCALPPEARREAAHGSPPPLEHTHAVVILIEERVVPLPGAPGDVWLRGGQRGRALLHGAEVACTLAGYIRLLGFAARAHFGEASEVDPGPLVVASGLGRPNRAGEAVVNPFLGTDFHAVVVTTSLPLTPDLPLASVDTDSALRVRHPGYWLGWWGGRPGWKRLRGDHRPAHLGRYPLEKLKRRDTPTTRIDPGVPRVPIRGSFFNRALAGDLGDRAKVERGRFALKHPFAAAMSPLFAALVPHQGGDPAPAPAAGTEHPIANTQALKAACHFMGADVVGVCEIPDYAWYSHDKDGLEVTPDHRYAVVVLIDQGYETMDGASGDDWISGGQSMRSYLRGAEITGVVARHLRALGHDARAHTNIKSDVLQLPLVLLSGLGELSRIGELVLNPFVGPRFKSAVITTDMPLVADKPIDFGLQDFCEQCLKCARECPCNAIPLGPKIMFNGYEIWKPDAEKCAKYRLTNQKGSACGRCMKMCPYNTEGLPRDKLGLWMAMHLPFTRKWLAHLDDWLGNGSRNPVKRWWFDIETVDGRVVRAKGANERDLRPDSPVAPEKQKIALYPADMQPPPGQQEPWPPDRKEALRRGEAAERVRP